MVQAAAERIRQATAAESAAHAEAEARSNEAATLRKHVAELEGCLSTADDAQVLMGSLGELHNIKDHLNMTTQC